MEIDWIFFVYAIIFCPRGNFCLRLLTGPSLNINLCFLERAQQIQCDLALPTVIDIMEIDWLFFVYAIICCPRVNFCLRLLTGPSLNINVIFLERAQQIQCDFALPALIDIMEIV